MRTRTPRRGGSIYIEILVAVSIFILMLIPLITGFQTGVQQTKIIRSHASARYLAEWALAEARSLIQANTFEEDPPGSAVFGEADLTSSVEAKFPATVAQLDQLELRRTIEPLTITGGSNRTRVYSIRVTVRWKDPKQPQLKELQIRGVEGEEI